MQKEYFGFNSIYKLEDLLNEFCPKKIFLVTGQNSFSFSGAEKKIIPMLKDKSFVIFNSSQNPEIQIIKKGIGLYKKNNPDLVVAIGGGSAIDIAKAVNVLAFQNDKPEDYIKGKKLEKIGKPLVAIPTTSGTGSEATHFATIYINKKKYSLANQELMLPEVSIVDPKLTESLPKYITAYTGLDAICQGIESFWSINSTDKSKAFAIDAVKIGFENIINAVNNPNIEARINMAKAANLSGKAINITKTTACHSVSYPMTAYYSIPHGHAVALTTPLFIEFNANVTEKDCNDKRGVDFVLKNLEKLYSIMDCHDSIECKTKLKELMERIGVNTKLHELKIDEKGIKLIINTGFIPNRMENNPRNVTKEDLKKIFKEIM